MSESKDCDPTNLHPTSQHRTPREIEADESGPIGHPPPDADVKHVFEATSGSVHKGRSDTKKKGKAQPET